MEMSKEIVPNRKSHFNNLVFIDECKICNKKGEDVHHIKFQCTANEKGFVSHFHKMKNII